MAFQRLLNGDFRSNGHVAMTAPPLSIAVRPLLHLSEACAEWLGRERARGLAPLTLADIRLVLWSIIEFADGDPPQREMDAGFPLAYLHWLRATPMARRKAKSLPREFTRRSVAAFLAWPPRRERATGRRSEQRIGHYWTHAVGFFKFLGLAIPELAKHEEPNMAIPPPLVPTRGTVRAWWRDALRPAPGREPGAGRRVVLTQGLTLATGMRIDEALSASLANVEGHWLLLARTKTHAPRILYLNGQALAIVQALHPAARQATLFEVETKIDHLAGWQKSLSRWHALVKTCATPAEHDPYPKRHQCLRKVLSTWLHERDPVAESAQLGHGGGVVYKNYLDILRRLPRLMDKFRLPELGVPGFAWPEPIELKVRRPDRLYTEFRRLVTHSRQ